MVSLSSRDRQNLAKVGHQCASPEKIAGTLDLTSEFLFFKP
jgi:hypothetical protein